MSAGHSAFRVIQTRTLFSDDIRVEGDAGVLLLEEGHLRFRRPGGLGSFHARRPWGFSLWRRPIYEISHRGEPAATVYAATLPVVNPVFRIELPEGESWQGWKRLMGDISITRRGAELLRMDSPICRRGWRKEEVTREVHVAEGEDPLLLLCVAALLARPI